MQSGRNKKKSNWHRLARERRVEQQAEAEAEYRRKVISEYRAKGESMSYVRVLVRDEFGRDRLWECSDCGKPFEKGWGSRCNACIIAAERHAELIAALSATEPKEKA